MLRHSHKHGHAGFYSALHTEVKASKIHDTFVNPRFQPKTANNFGCVVLYIRPEQ